jgi:acyl carrier protein
MNELDEKLADCFQAALPGISRNELRNASMKTTPGWDSVVTITLVSLIEESFGVQTQPADIGKLTSFQSIREYLAQAAAHASR